MLERKVYSAWAFDRDGVDKANINRQIYEQLEPKVKWCYIDYHTKKSNYRILSNPYGFNKDELALICDAGNLCFGYRMKGSDVVVIYTD